MKRLSYILFLGFFISYGAAMGQDQEIRLGTLHLSKKEAKNFRSSRDSSIRLVIDTLIMEDKSSLRFNGKKDVDIEVQHAFIGENAYISGVGSQNNASNFTIDIGFEKLGSLSILARGIDATNGTKTFPNGDGGNVTLTYNPAMIVPQTQDKKDQHYLQVDVNPGGLHVTPSSEVGLLYSRIAQAPRGLRGLPQGQVYSGSAGQEGKVEIKPKE